MAKNTRSLRDPKRRPTHPGEILREDVLPALRMTQTELAQRLGVSRLTVSEILHEKRPVSVEPNTTLRDYFLVSLLTGARRGNVLTMRWQDINFERAEWRISRTKNNDPQTITLSPEAIEVLLVRNRDSEYVFPGAGACGHLVEPRKGWLRILARAGISDLRIHDLRRTLGSWQAKTGASLVIIGKSLNHKNVQTTAIYARLDTDPVRESLARATSAMLTAAGLKPAGEVIKLKQSIEPMSQSRTCGLVLRLSITKHNLTI